MAITVKPVTEGLSETWDTIVQNSPHGTAFHLWDYVNIMERHSWINLLGRKVCAKGHFLMGFKGEAPLGVFPVYTYTHGPLRIAASPPPRTGTYYLGPVMESSFCPNQSRREKHYFGLMQAVDDYLFTTLKIHYANVSVPQGLGDARPLWGGYRVEPLYDYIIDISGDLDSIQDSFVKKLRWSIRFSEKQDFSFEVGSEEDLLSTYHSYMDRVVEQGIGFRMDEDILIELFNRFNGKNIFVFPVRAGDESIGGVIVTCVGQTVSVWMGCNKSTKATGTSNDYMHWELIKWAKEQGYTQLRFTWANTKRLCRYKSKYNPRLDPYFFARKYSSPLIQALSEAYMHLRHPL